jgi:hypothetical protein
MPKQRVFRPQKIYYPDSKKFLNIWLNDSNSDLTRDRIMFRTPCGEEGIPMFLLLDKSRSELQEILGEPDRKIAYERKIVLTATVSH